MYVPDNYDMWAKHDAEQEAKLENLPECSECGEHIQDEHCYCINDEVICARCMYSNHLVLTEDVI